MIQATEHEIQSTLVEWVRFNEHIDDRLSLLFAVPNGGLRSKRTAARLKREGVVAGVPDLCLPVPGLTYSSLFIEFKVPGGRRNKAQREWAQKALGKGPNVVICYSWLDAAREIVYHLRPTKLRAPTY